MLLEKTQIIINDARFFARHGALPQEQLTGGWFVLNVRIDCPFARAIDEDNLEATLSYADVYAVLKREMAVPGKLLEHVAGRIAKALFAEFPLIERVDIELTKETPPMGGDTRGAAVRIVAASDKDGV
ncbi:MAG: dihydroneopterin aldolase [Prevotella sp.]|nr:dihydroneopterin aldolase [Prevotella sp.]